MMGAQTINRAIHNADNPYVMTRRDSAQDDKLSYEAAGMLLLLLSKPDDWIIKAQTLVREGCTIKKVYRIFSELIDAGYMKREAVRDDLGRISEWVYQVFEEPQPKEGKHPLGKKSTHGQIHLVDNPPGGKLPRLLNKEKKQSKEKNKTEQELPANSEQVVTPAAVIALPEENAVVRIYQPPVKFEETRAKADPEIVKAAEAAMSRLEGSKPAAEKVEITPDGVRAGAAFKAQFDKLDEDIQQALQKLVTQYGLYAVVETIKQINPVGVKSLIGLLIWKLDDLQAKGTLPKPVPYSPTCDLTYHRASPEPVNIHPKQRIAPSTEPHIQGDLANFKRMIAERQQRERVKDYVPRSTV